MAISPLRIGSLQIWPPVMSAPMAGYTGGVYREILREHGCPYSVTEMVSAKGLLFGGDESEEILVHTSQDRPLAVQIFGYEPESMAAAAEMLSRPENGFDVIDINMGCPARKITSQGSGGALLKDVARAAEIVSAVKEASRLPVTVKMRLGWDDPSGAQAFAGEIASAGASLIVVHGRTVSQGYSGKADWNMIEEIAKAVPVPVVGNGDVTSPLEALNILEKGPCAGVMVGRAILGNPVFFEELLALIKGEAPREYSPERKMRLAKEHFVRSIERYGEKKGLLEMRKQLVYYFRGMKGAARLRELVLRERTPEGVVKLLEEGWRAYS
ncbi:MAG TPA: tRNA dihydrouridine synthase DusB [Firmicutes bacterium]|nr:tRNA dihydrouridine synthase DusB [Candidatus Fermentithermobacillaceae bacterium]